MTLYFFVFVLLFIIGHLSRSLNLPVIPHFLQIASVLSGDWYPSALTIASMANAFFGAGSVSFSTPSGNVSYGLREFFPVARREAYFLIWSSRTTSV